MVSNQHAAVEAETCRLCNQRASLRDSHIVPSFAVRWIKNTSITGYFRSPVKPNLPLQQAKRAKLLCGDCEGRFSRWEKLFAENIFTPYHTRQASSFNYDEWLLKFAVSFSWRAFESERVQIQQRTPELVPEVDKATKQWRRYLLSQTDDSGPYEHHMFFLDFVKRHTGLTLPRFFEWYLMRSVDSTPAYTDDGNIFGYGKLAQIILVTFVRPFSTTEWRGTRIEKSGSISTPQEILSGDFGAYLLERARIADEVHDRMSPKQHTLIKQRTERQMLKILKSDKVVLVPVPIGSKKE